MSNSHPASRSIIVLFFLNFLFLMAGCGGDDDGVETADGIGKTIDSTVTIDASVPAGDAPIEAKFSVKSDDLVLSQLWNFGDGTTADTINPNSSVKHTYTEDGIYTVSVVTETNLGGAQSDSITIKVGSGVSSPVTEVFLNNLLPDLTISKVVGSSSVGDVDFNFQLISSVTGEPTAGLEPGERGYIEVKCDVTWGLDLSLTDVDGNDAGDDQIGMQLYLCGVKYEWEVLEL